MAAVDRTAIDGEIIGIPAEAVSEEISDRMETEGHSFYRPPAEDKTAEKRRSTSFVGSTSDVTLSRVRCLVARSKSMQLTIFRSRVRGLHRNSARVWEAKIVQEDIFDSGLPFANRRRAIPLPERASVRTSRSLGSAGREAFGRSDAAMLG